MKQNSIKADLLANADKILDEYNAGTLSKDKMLQCMKPISVSLQAPKGTSGRRGKNERQPTC